MSPSIRVSLLITTLVLSTAALSAAGEWPDRKFSDGYDGQLMRPITNESADKNPFIPPTSYWLLETDQVRTVYTNYGHFGTGSIGSPVCDGEFCPSFESPAHSDIEYLFTGAVWIGGIVGDDTLVSVAADGWFWGVFEFWPDQQGFEFDGLGDQSVRTLFTDTITDPDLTGIDPIDNRNHIPLNLRVANRAFVWNTDPEDNLVIYDMVITNIGDDAIQEGYLAFYFDADVYHTDDQANGFTDDITGSLRDDGIAYIIDNDGDPTDGAFDETSPTRLFAFKFLETSFAALDTGYDWWISNGNPSLDFGPQPTDEYGNVECDFGGENIGTPTGDPGKYCVMSHPGWDYDQITAADSMPGWTYPRPDMALDFVDGYDTRFLMSIGPFDLDPDSSARVIYMTFTGDSVHHVVDNIDNLPDNPDLYRANLDFTHVLDNAATADLITPMLVNSELAPIGFSIWYDCLDSVVTEWDPYGFPGVDGYEVYLYKVPPDSMPYPDVIPPWLELTDLSVMELVANTGMDFRYTFDTLTPTHFYFASVANHTTGGTGQLCKPITLRPGGRIPGPIPENKFVFVEEGGLAAILWAEPDGVDVDHYNVYKLAEGDTVPGLFYPFYDKGEFSDTVAPADSFYRNDQWYFYYVMEPHAQSDSGFEGIFDYAENNTQYYVTVVDKTGLESDFSEPITVFIVEPSTPRDILVINCKKGTFRVDRVECDSVTFFYDYTFGGLYDRYDMPETLNTYGDYKPEWWRDLIPYRMVIMDGGFENDNMCEGAFCNTVHDLEKYIQSGGKLAYFGSFPYFSGHITSSPGYVETDNWWFINQYFGIDSIFHIGMLYYYTQSDPPYLDTLAGIIAATPAIPETPYITYNPLVNALGSFSLLWDENTVPSPSAFAVNTQGQTIYRVETMYPATSMIDNQPIGVKTSVAGTATYLFGFHLWYMDPDEAALLVEYLFNDDTGGGNVCGDANGDGTVDVGDAVFLINYIFRGGWPPYPASAGDVNGDFNVDVGDAVYLVNYIFRDGPPPQCR